MRNNKNNVIKGGKKTILESCHGYVLNSPTQRLCRLVWGIYAILCMTIVHKRVHI